MKLCSIVATRILPGAFFSCLLLFTSAQNKGFVALPTAKFMTGDVAGYSAPSLDDGAWREIRTGDVWQVQGYPDYHGYAWYRIHVTIPSSLKDHSLWKDSLRIFLAHVNDVDATYLNGVLIGHTGGFPDEAGGYVSKWPAVRAYPIPVGDSAIRWDKDNVIAIRVYDGGGSGGIFMGSPYIDVLEKMDGVHFENDIHSFGYGKSATGAPVVTKRLRVNNEFNTTVSGHLQYMVKDEETGKSYAKTVAVTLDPFGWKELELEVPHREGISLTYVFSAAGAGEPIRYEEVLPYLLTPAEVAVPKLHGADVVGVRPGSPFLYKIAATGKGALVYGADGLPAGVRLNGEKGLLEGVVATRGSYVVTLRVRSALGSAVKHLTIKVGDVLALTPQMGWNSWNCWGINVSDAKVRSSAQALIDKGLINYGWSYINVDDGWEAAVRAADGNIVPNAKFPAMGKLGDWLHGNGLKFGIYSSPGNRTCGGFLGSYQHEQQDAAMYASWGIDYLKYDWCSYSDQVVNDSSLAAYMKPYEVMQQALEAQPRDVLYSLCQYGMKDVWKWGADVHGNSWRTTEDITDTWESLYGIGFNQASLYPYAKPGRWNDPDMLIVGMVGWGENLHPTHLTPYEQYTHISLWSLLSAPLLIGCDISKLDTFTLNLLKNDEVLAIDQDTLGRQAQRVVSEGHFQVWVKTLSDGNKAVGVFNLDSVYHPYTLALKDVAGNGKVTVRDVWKQERVAVTGGSVAFRIPPHGVRLLKVISGH